MSELHSHATHLGPVRYIDGCSKYSTHVPVHIEKTENFDFGEALTLKFDVLDNILSYLSHKDLNNVAQLNDTWANRVAAVLKKRISPTLFSFTLTCYNVPEPVASKPSICMVFLEHSTHKALQVKLNTYICIHKLDSEKKKTVIEFLENDLISTQCPLVALTCRNISSSFTEVSSLNGLVLPTIPNVKMSVFRVKDARKNMSDLLDLHIGKENNLACLLTFAICVRKKNLRALVSGIQDRQPLVNFAFGGGFVMGMQAFNHTNKKQSLAFHKKDELLCVAFSTPQNMDVPFNAYSIIIPENATTDDDIEEYFLKLRNSYTPRKFGIAFRITCVSREDEIRKEMELFSKYFPYVEILGFSGDGEIGWDYYKSDDHAETEVKKRKLNTEKKLFHVLTTVFVLLTWGKERKI